MESPTDRAPKKFTNHWERTRRTNNVQYYSDRQNYLEHTHTHTHTPLGWAGACVRWLVWCHRGRCNAPALSAVNQLSHTAERCERGRSVWTSDYPGSHLLPANTQQALLRDTNVLMWCFWFASVLVYRCHPILLEILLTSWEVDIMMCIWSVFGKIKMDMFLSHFLNTVCSYNPPKELSKAKNS